MQCGTFRVVELRGEHVGIASGKRDEIETRLTDRGRNGKIDHFEVLEVMQQVVAGMVYLFKIRLQPDGDECVFVKLFRDLDSEVHVSAIADNKRVSDELTPAVFDDESG